MRRLSITVFIAVLGSLLVFALAVMGLWHLGIESRTAEFESQLGTELAAGVLPVADRSRVELQRALDRWHERAKIDLALFDADGKLIARAGRPIPRPGDRVPGPDDDGQRTGNAEHDRATERKDGAERNATAGHHGGPRRRWVATVELDDGRQLFVRPARDRVPRSPIGVVAGLGLLLAAVALVAWPVSRRITRRLERLKGGVELLGSGDLGARVAVEGQDEVAALARSFNASAAHIEELVATKSRLLDTQRRLLANASHELRSPLARMRMGLALLDDDGGPIPARAEIERNITELDQLIEEILTASRLDNAERALEPDHEPVDLAGIAVEEAVRVGAEVEIPFSAEASGQIKAESTGILVRGDARLLRRLVRNLLENAHRYHPRRGESDDLSNDNPDSGGNATRIRVLLSRDDERVRLEVLDRGPGVAVDERERIFEAFYRPGGHLEKSGGVGLGLSLVRQIAQAHGGHAQCLERVGGGARFVVELPAY